ncbi:MAG: 50S ribosomal protein L24 [Clostridiales bacterium]|jgi:large subunit ribosomal protein L24|nr:50S ribosomal protein L24 [Clostridiales bacterium]
MNNVKKGDVVMVISGANADKTATVVSVNTETNRVTIEGEGIKKIKKSVKPKRAQDKGGIIEQDGTVHVSNVMPICGKCNKPTRVSHKEIEVEGKTKKVRVCVKCGEVLESPKLSQTKKEGKAKVRKIARKSDKDNAEEK